MIEYLESLTQIEIIGLIVLVVGILLFLFNSRAIFLAIASENWTKTKGEILLSELNIIETTGEPDKSFNPKVKYKYIVNGLEYYSTRIYFGNKIASSFKKRKSLRILKKYKKGQLVDIFYNPMNEKLSVLEPGIKYEPVSLLVIGLICIVGGYLMINNIE